MHASINLCWMDSYIKEITAFDFCIEYVWLQRYRRFSYPAAHHSSLSLNHFIAVGPMFIRNVSLVNGPCNSLRL